jgi:hypothetical protein
MNTLKCYTYWDKGQLYMPKIIKNIYRHNYNMSLQYNFDLILITDDNINNLLELPSNIMNLNYKFKSEIIRF